MPSLNPLEQLAVDAFATALETCREEGVKLPEEVKEVAHDLEHHAAVLSEMAKQHPQLNAAYRTARKLLRQTEGERKKRLGTSNQITLEPMLTPSGLLGEVMSKTTHTNDSAVTSDQGTTLAQPTANTPVQSVIYRYTLPDTASPQAAIAFTKQVEAIRQSNPDWVVNFDRPNPGEVDAIVLIHKDEYYVTTHTAYIANRTLNQVVEPALNRVFGKTLPHTKSSLNLLSNE